MNYPYEKASPQHRLGGYALEAALATVTFGIGYMIWALIVWGQGQTPGKQILRMRVYATETQRPATWGHMAVRQLLVPTGISFALIIPFGLISLLFPDTAGFFIFFIYSALFIFQLVDAFWILKDDGRRRLIDIWAKTDVLNECNPTS